MILRSLRSAVFGSGLALCLSAGAFIPKVQAQVYVIDSPQATRCYDAASTGATDQRSIDRCTSALERDGLVGRNYAGTLVNRGVIRLRAGQTELALADFDAGVTLVPTLGEAWVNRGAGLLVKGGADDEVIADVTRGLALGSSHRELAFYLRGYARERANDWAGAYGDYRRASLIAPAWQAPQLEMARFEVRPR